jgi:hypothetical protein
LWWSSKDELGKASIICGVVCRHPRGDLDTFIEYLNSGIEKINQENKICVIMGDFNVDLLKVDSHQNSDKYYGLILLSTPYLATNYNNCHIN